MMAVKANVMNGRNVNVKSCVQISQCQPFVSIQKEY
jgi:hypothetical protein